MNLTVQEVYSVRFGPMLPLPKGVQDNIAKLRITPTTYKSFRPRPRAREPENWRNQMMQEFVRRVKERDDPEYSDIFALLNKIASSNFDKLSSEVIEILKKRDEKFRLRVITLIFNKSIREHGYASIMSDCLKKIAETFGDAWDDINLQIEMFPKLYDMTETIVFPSSDEADFDNKVINWMVQKDKRRGYSKFMTQLFVRALVTEETIYQSLKIVIDDLNETAKQPKTPQTDENTTQFVDFLFESAKLLPKESKNLRSLINDSLSAFLAIPRQELTSLCMRSRFKVEDTLKCVQTF